jgi:hypothetical protein
LESRVRSAKRSLSPKFGTTDWPFTFTLICHLGKTHDHRSRGDTTRRAQRAAHPHTQTNKAPHSHTWTPDRTNTKKGRGCQGVKERSRGGHLSRSQTLPARTYRGESATLAPGPLPVRLARGTARPRKRLRRASTSPTPSLQTFSSSVYPQVSLTCRHWLVASGVGGRLIAIRVEQGGSS